MGDGSSRVSGGDGGAPASAERVRLRVEDVEDLAVIAALLQDARIPLKEMAYDPGEGRFMGAFNRYCRELLADPSSCAGIKERPSALVFDCIREVKYRNLDVDDVEQELVLLTIATEPGRKTLYHIDLVFEGDREIQLRSDCLDCRLEDFGPATVSKEPPCDRLSEPEAILLQEVRGDAAKA